MKTAHSNLLQSNPSITNPLRTTGKVHYISVHLHRVNTVESGCLAHTVIRRIPTVRCINHKVPGLLDCLAVKTAEQLVLDGVVQKAKRQSYTREEKLKVIHFYHSNGENLYQTSKKFLLNTKTV